MYDRKRDPEAFRASVLDLSRNLCIDQFKPLSEGVGLGGLHPSREKANRQAPLRPTEALHEKMQQRVVEVQQPVARSDQAVSRGFKPEVSRIGNAEQGSFSTVLSKAMAVLCDLAVVAISALTLFAGVIFLLFGRVEPAQFVAFVQEVHQQGQSLTFLGMLSGGLLSLYIVYWMVFRLVAGVTLGRYLFSVAGKKERYQTATSLDNSLNEKI